MVEMKELIEKWEAEFQMHLRASKDVLMYTKEQRTKSAHYAAVIASFLADLKELNNNRSKIKP